MRKPTIKDVSFLFAAMAGLLVFVLVFYSVVFSSRCYKSNAPTYAQLLTSLNSNYKLKHTAYRTMASRIYEYRIANEYSRIADTYISIFMAKQMTTVPPPSSELNDFCLYKLATSSTDRFNILVSYIPIFNHPRYIECIKSYDTVSKTFKSIDPDRSTKEIIIRDVLNIDDASKATLSESILSYVQQSNPTFDASTVTPFINSWLSTTTDESLYNLLINGYIGSP